MQRSGRCNDLSSARIAADHRLELLERRNNGAVRRRSDGRVCVVARPRDREHTGGSCRGQRHRTDEWDRGQRHHDPTAPALLRRKGRRWLALAKKLGVGEAEEPGKLAPVTLEDVARDVGLAELRCPGGSGQIGGEGQPQVADAF